MPITIYRDNQRKSLNITPDELDLEAEAQAGSARRPNSAGAQPSADGDRLRHAARGDHAGDRPRQLDLPRGRGGAIVTDVDRGSAAARAGVQPNDVILEVNRQPVANVSQVTRALQNATAGTPVFLRGVARRPGTLHHDDQALEVTAPTGYNPKASGYVHWPFLLPALA